MKKAWYERIVQTFSPDRMTWRPSISALCLDDLTQWTSRLFFRLRCSCRLVLAWD